jgi:hypothetical protein
MRRLEWFGLVARTDQTRDAKKSFKNIPEIITKAGRLRQISTGVHGGPLIKSDAENDLRELEVRRWTQRAIDGEEW